MQEFRVLVLQFSVGLKLHQNKKLFFFKKKVNLKKEQEKSKE